MLLHMEPEERQGENMEQGQQAEQIDTQIHRGFLNKEGDIYRLYHCLGCACRPSGLDLRVYGGLGLKAQDFGCSSWVFGVRVSGLGFSGAGDEN